MAEQISFNALRAFDLEGLPAAGAQAYFYETGTTTPVTVYTTAALLTAHPSPLVADADGYFAQVFSDGAVQIKAIVKDATDVTLSTVDPVSVSFTSSAATSVTFTPSAAIPQTNVQAAVEQVQTNVETAQTTVQTNLDALSATLGTAATKDTQTTITDSDTVIPTSGAVIDRIPVSLNASGTAPIYACRAWVNFNGTGAAVIRASGNVASVTYNGVGDYTVTFTTAMPDANYTAVASGGNGTGIVGYAPTVDALTTTTVRVSFRSVSPSAAADVLYGHVAIFR